MIPRWGQFGTMLGVQCTRTSFRRVQLSRSNLQWSVHKMNAVRTVRCMASGNDSDKSWQEIAQDTTKVAKDIFGKIVKTGKDTIGSITKKDSTKKPVKKDQDDIFQPPGGGLIGGLLGGMMNMALKSLSEQIEESQKAARDVYSQSVARVQQSSEVRKSLGEVSCSPPYSQSSSSESVNGVFSNKTSIIFEVMGSRGFATVQADGIESPNGVEKLTVKVRLPTGKVLDIEDDSFGGGGRVIDAQWTER